MLAACPPGCALAVVVVQFGRVSRPGLARRTVGLPASQPRSGPSLLRLETQKLPQLALLQLVTLPTNRFLAVSLWPSVVAGECSHKSQCFFHGYITVKKVLSAHLACLAAVVNLAKNQLREVLIAPCSPPVQVQQTCGGSRHCSAEAARLGLRVRRSAVAVRSSSGPTVGIAAAHGPAPPLRRCCTRHTVCRDCTEKSCANY